MNSVISFNPDKLGLIVRLSLAGLIGLVLNASTCAGETGAPPDTRVTIENIEVGFQGLYKVGEWTLLWVTMNSTHDCEVTVVVDVPDADDNLTSLPGRPFAVKAGAALRREACFRTGRLSGELQVRIVDSKARTLASRRLRAAGEVRSELRPALRLDRPLWITLGNLNLSGDSAEGDSEVQANSESGREPRIARLNSPGDLPTDWRALQSVELLVFPTANQSAPGSSLLGRLTPEHDAVLREWVRMGGHLVVSVGSETTAFQQSPFAKWFKPIVVEDRVQVRQLSSLESFAGQHAALNVKGTVSAASLGRLPAANAIVKHTGSPQALVASIPFGFGQLTLVGVDIETPPMSNWKALMPFLQKLAGRTRQAATNSSRKVNRQLTHVGVTDLATQFQQINEDFLAVGRRSYWWVMGLILVYLAVIGPLDYLLVHRALRRPEFTWLTFPVLVCAAVTLAAWDAARTNDRGLLVNQFDLVDIDAASGFRRARTWVSLYSPDHCRFSVAVEPLAAGAQPSQPDSEKNVDVQLGWMAPPENAVGGVYRSGAASFGGRSYRFAPGAAEVENLPVAQWSTKSLAAAWEDSLPSASVDCRLESFGPGNLKGTVTHHLDAPLEDCLLVVGGWAYVPTTADATLAPHFEWRPSGAAVQQRDLKALLTGEKRIRRNKDNSLSSEILATTEIYNPLGRNRRDLVRMLSFHEAVGGTDYTGLAHAALRDLELTGLMQLGRGILVGRLAAPAAQVDIDESPAQPASRSTWVRLVLPVSQSDLAPDKTIPKASERSSFPPPNTGNPP